MKPVKKKPRLKVGDVVVLHPNTLLIDRTYPRALRIGDVGIVERVAFTRECMTNWDSFYVRFFSDPGNAYILWEVEIVPADEPAPRD